MTGESQSILQTLSQSVRGIDSTRQLALGVAIGMTIGFIPKENLIFVGLLVVLIITGANLVTGLLSAIAASLLGQFMQSAFHFAGSEILATKFMQSLLSRVMHQPLVAWTDINNTIVCGALFFGLAMFVPIYFFSFGLFHNVRSKIKALYRARMVRMQTSYAAESS